MRGLRFRIQVLGREFLGYGGLVWLGPMLGKQVNSKLFTFLAVHCLNVNSLKPNPTGSEDIEKPELSLIRNVIWASASKAKT